LRRCFISLGLAVLFPALLVLEGCGGGVIQPILGQTGDSLHGRVLDGLQPVSGAAITLFAAGSNGVGTGATNLLTQSFTTDTSGAFVLTGYTCPSATAQIYAVARGGNPGLAPAINNAALVFLTPIGNCGDVNNTSSIVLDETTTVASAWALAPFLGAGAAIGATSTNAIGLRNAFATANNLVDVNTGLAPGAALPQGTTVESAKLNTLANALAVCADSNGTTACGALFSSATVGGYVPSDTLDAALNIVRNPSANIAAIFNAASIHGPFQPALTAQPHDWTMSMTHGCSSGCGGLNLPGSLAIDSTGNIWVANYFGGVVSEFSPTGVPIAANGFSGEGLYESYGITIDAQSNVWIANEQSVTGANNSHGGSVSKFSPAGAELSAYGYVGGGIYYPQALAADSTGDIWVADYGHSAATLLANDGSAISGSGGYGASALPFASAVAIDASHNAWFAVEGAAARVSPAGVVSSFACCSPDPSGVAVDQIGNIWIADFGASSVVELTSSGAVAHRITLAAGANSPQSLAIDGMGDVWTANYRGNSIAEVAGSTAALLSPELGYGLDAALDEPYGLGIDASGNLWLSNSGNDTLTEIVGLASPIATPLLGPPVQP